MGKLAGVAFRIWANFHPPLTEHPTLCPQPRGALIDDEPMDTPKKPFAVPPAAGHRGTAAESVEREFHQMRELPWVNR